MVQLNKYLREIGIDENYWLFDKDNQDDSRYRPDEEGFVNAEFFSLDTSLSLYIYSQLCYFREYCLCGYPAGMDGKKWESILDKMIEAFKLMIIEEPDKEFTMASLAEKLQISKNKEKKINYGLKLFIKYYRCLWY